MESRYGAFGLYPPFNRKYVGISRCDGGCGQLSLFPYLNFCQGPYHQTRRSHCLECYIVDANGEEVDTGSSGRTHEEKVRDAKALHAMLVERGVVPNLAAS